MSKTIEISRELAERLTRYYPAEITDAATLRTIRIQALQALDELRALLAAPVVERQDVLPCDVKVAPNTTIKKGCKVETLLQCIEIRRGQPDKFTRFERKSPPAPVAVVLPEKHEDRCDSSEAEAYQNGWNACLDKVKELNQ